MFDQFPSFVQGAIWGVLIAAVLFGLEYYLLKKQARERAVRHHRPNQVEFDQTELARLRAVRNMCLVVPLFFALMWWMIF
jgi:Na+/H+-dicarboxylate symporter